MHASLLVPDRGGKVRRRMRTLAEADQGFGEMRVGVHGDMTGDVVEDVRLGR